MRCIRRPPSKLLTVLAIVSLCSFASIHATVLVDDSFDILDSGSNGRQNDAADPRDSAWWNISSASPFAVTTDPGGINDGNAMEMGVAGGDAVGVSPFGTIGLNTVGDYLQATMDFRRTGNQLLRLGLHHDGGTPAVTDHGNRSVAHNDAGYFLCFNADSGGSTSGYLMRDIANQTYLSGSWDDVDTLNEAFTIPNALGSTKHTAEFTITRIVDGVEIQLVLDPGETNEFTFVSQDLGAYTIGGSGRILPAGTWIPPNTTLNEIGWLSRGGNLLFDNVLITTNIPEPTTWCLLILGTLIILPLWHRRCRHRA